MLNNKLKAAAELYIDSMIPSVSQYENISFTPRFEKKMRSVIRGQKNKVLYLTIRVAVLTLVISLSGAVLISQITTKTPDYNLEVSAEEFESLSVSSGYGMYRKFHLESEIYEYSDIVVIGMPVNCYTEDETRFYDTDGKIVEEDAEGFKVGYTARPVKVLEVLKGEGIPEQITVEQMGFVDTIEDSNRKIIRGLAVSEYICKKNVKYIYYLKDTGRGQSHTYYALPDRGTVNVDGLDDRCMQNESAIERYEQAKERFSEYFEKYDRSDESQKNN